MNKKVLKEIHEIQEMMGISKVAKPIMKAFKMNVPEEMTEVEEGEMTEQYRIPTLQVGDTLCDIKCGKKAARSGSKGDVVKTLQLGLIDCGFALPNYGADGKYGNETSEAVKRLQTENEITVDGVIGPETIVVMIDKGCVKVENCNCEEKKSFDDDAISDEQRRGREDADEYEKEQSKKRDDEMMKNLPIKGDGYECEKCPKYINRMPGPNREELTNFEAWCINDCDTKVVV